MATYNIANVRAAIKTILQAVSSVESVYDFQQANIAGYPAAIFELDNEDSTILDDVNNQRVLTFKIWVVCEVSVNGTENASQLLDSVSKDVINALELQGNMTLSGNADWTMPVIGQRQQVVSEQGNFFYQELNLKVYIASTIL